MTERLSASFRDPAGFMFRRDGHLYRQVNESARADFDHLMNSGLYDELVGRGLLVAHSIVDEPLAEAGSSGLVIKPEVVPFISYPFEWSPGQLRAAALATLEIQSAALAHGMTLRDASAYNIQFLNGRATLIDTLSLGQYDDGDPWVAYGQFCRHFVAPLALMTYVDVRLGQLTRVHLDGIPLDLASELLPRRTRYKFGVGVHVHAHASSQKRHAGDAGDARKSRARNPRVSELALAGLLDSLSGLVKRLDWTAPPSAWRDYYKMRESYSERSLDHKTQLVTDFLRSTSPSSIWDLGANTGHFSRLAAEVTGVDVVAIEMDPSAVQIMWQEAGHDGAPRVLPVWMDLSNPTPAQGWAHDERDSLEARGPVDLAIALAVVHHLAIGNNVPLDRILDWFARIARQVVFEWVPKDDPMVQRMLASREDVFADYSTESFDAAVAKYFRVVRREAVNDSDRTLYLLERW